jgi:hypothetical protein
MKRMKKSAARIKRIIRMFVPSVKQFLKYSLLNKYTTLGIYWSIIATLLLGGIQAGKYLLDKYAWQQFHKTETLISELVQRNEWDKVLVCLENNKALLTEKNNGEVYNYYYGLHLLKFPPRSLPESNPSTYFERITDKHSPYFERAQIFKTAYYESASPSVQALNNNYQRLLTNLEQANYKEPVYFFIKFRQAINTDNTIMLKNSYQEFLNNYPVLKSANYQPYVVSATERDIDLNIMHEQIALIYLYNKAIFDIVIDKAERRAIGEYMNRIFKSDNEIGGISIGFDRLCLARPNKNMLKKIIQNMLVL